MIFVALDPDELKHGCDFVALAGHYTRLRCVGAQYRGLCPFHSERNPSLYIEPLQKLWKCFGCERGGDVFDFVMLAEDCDFPSALRIISDLSGVVRESEPRSGERFRAREGVSEANPSARVAGVQHSPNSRDSILAALSATERRNTIIARANAESFTEFERDCEPRDGGQPFLLVNKRISGHE